jgi:hypothetical protein
MKFFKAMIIVALAASALGLAACSQHKEPAPTTTSTYSK